MSAIRLAGVVKESIVDGPGFRFVVFTQGCPHHCEGCHNPQSHSFEGGTEHEPEEILREIDKNPLLAGVTFSGGEPFCQPGALCELAKGVKERGLNLITYSGYTYEQLAVKAQESPAVRELLGYSDYLVDGRYVAEQRDLNLRFRGSRNQRIIDIKASAEAGMVITTEL